jgi:replication factor A1
MSERSGFVPVASLKPGMNGVNVRVRVLEVSEPREIETRSGRRTISEAVVGDTTGRVRLTLWGRKAGSISPGEAIEIVNAWTTSFRGQVVLNAGAQSSIRKVRGEDLPEPDSVPDKYPRAPVQRSGRRASRGQVGRRSRSRRSS